MKRQEAVSLLREIMTSCKSFETASAVSIKLDAVNQGYLLYAKWVPLVSELSCLDVIKQRYDVHIN